MSTILGLDTTSRHSSLAIHQDGELLVEHNFISQNTLSSSLIPLLDFILGNLGLTLEQLDAIGVSTGPGSFTGIRVGLSTLKGLLFGRSLPVVPVSALEAWAYKCQDMRQRVISLIDARRKEVYVGGYDFSEESGKEVLMPQLASVTDLEVLLKDLSDPLLIGSGVSAYENQLLEFVAPDQLLFRSPHLAAEICQIASIHKKSKRVINDIQRLTPDYIRQPDAELNKKS